MKGQVRIIFFFLIIHFLSLIWSIYNLIFIWFESWWKKFNLCKSVKCNSSLIFFMFFFVKRGKTKVFLHSYNQVEKQTNKNSVIYTWTIFFPVFQMLIPAVVFITLGKCNCCWNESLMVRDSQNSNKYSKSTEGLLI